MLIRSLCSGAEDCVQAMGLSGNASNTIRSYLLNCTIPSDYCEIPRWMGFRVQEAVKNLFGMASARRESIKIISDHLFVQKIPNRSPIANASVLEKVSKAYLDLASEELLSFALFVQERNSPSSKEVGARLLLLQDAIDRTLREIHLHRF